MKRMIKVGALLILAASASLSYAGARYQNQVYVSQQNRVAYGSLVDARGSADNQQYIGCYVYNGQAGCYAIDASGFGGSCYTTDAATIATIRSVSSESIVYFTWNNDGTCNYMQTNNISYGKPAALSGY